MPMKKAMPGGKIVNQVKYEYAVVKHIQRKKVMALW